ncbi:hypothetical protein FQN57_006601 [Myotisia sp. PD_48]|nr:hypothetical protein FQN57_006601 [Myotisia sp. PD_48]
MIRSPNKRRKSNSSTAVSVNPLNTVQDPVRPSKSPTRPSFRAPTRASLSRHHPDVLSRAIERSAAEKSRRPSVKDYEYLNGNAENGTLVSLGPSSRTSLAQSHPDGLPQIARAVSRPRSSQSNEQFPKESQVSEESAERYQSGTPNLESEEVDVSPTMMADGMDLLAPLTPTKAGLKKLSKRPLDPLNISPSPRARMKRNRTLEEMGIRRAHKSRGAQPVQEKAKTVDIAVTMDEAPKGIQEKKEFLVSLQEQLNRLKGEISLIGQEAARLRQSNATDNLDEDGDRMERLLKLLTTSNPSCSPPPKPPTPPSLSCMLSYLLPFTAAQHIPPPVPNRAPSPPPENPYALKLPEEPLPYLTVFAPLTLSSEAMTTTISKLPGSTPDHHARIIQTSRFVLSPPLDFSTAPYHIPIVLESDPEKQAITSISIPPTSSDTLSKWAIPSTLLRWINSRLSDQLFALDISGLCWGICRYWEATMSRAKIWVQLQTLSDKLANDPKYLERAGDDDENSVGDELKYPARVLIPYSEQATYRFSTRKGGTDASKIFHLLISCQISLDLWTSEPQLDPDICVSCASLSDAAASKIEKEVKRVFRGMLMRGRSNNEFDMEIGSLVKAVEAVVVILFGHV